MSQPIIKTNDITDLTITGSKIGTDQITNSKISSGISYSKILDYTLPGAVWNNGIFEHKVLAQPMVPNLLRNGSFDESDSLYPPGWTYGTGTLLMTGDGLSNTHIAGRPVSGPGRAVQISSANGTFIALSQQVNLSTGLGFIPGSDTTHRPAHQVIFSCSFKSTAFGVGGDPVRALIRLTLKENGIDTVTTTYESNQRTGFTGTWRTANLTATPVNPVAGTSFFATVELGNTGTEGTNILYYDECVLSVVSVNNFIGVVSTNYP